MTAREVGMPQTRRLVEAMESWEIETRMEQLQREYLPPGPLAIYEVYQSVLFERLHHEAQIHAIKYAKVFARRLAKRWLRRYAVKEREVNG